MKTVTAALDQLPLADSANQTLAQFVSLTGINDATLTGAGLLYERAFMMGLTLKHRFSPNGSCHLVPCQDALLAVNLPRPSDWELLPAWLGPWCDSVAISEGDWDLLDRQCASLPCQDLLQQAHMLGLAVARADVVPASPPHPVTYLHFNVDGQRRTKHTIAATDAADSRIAPLVVDLSSLWAGPLCSHLLQRAGCRVVKVEGLNRLDGARTGSPDFYRLLNQGKESVVLDFRSPNGIARLRQLLDYADIVIEAARPRALHNLGIHAETWVQAQQGRVWVSITGYGRDGSEGERIGFGDDAGAAAGLSHIHYDATGEYHIVGDAIADPLTGLHAARHAWQCYRDGGNALLALSLQGTVSFCLQQALQQNREQVLESCRQWQRLGSRLDQLFPAGPRAPTQECADPGQHNAAVLAELDLHTRPQHHDKQ